MVMYVIIMIILIIILVLVNIPLIDVPEDFGTNRVHEYDEEPDVFDMVENLDLVV